MDIAQKFLPAFKIDRIEAISSGHIQQTFLVIGVKGVSKKSIILQAINTQVFPNPELLVKNHLVLSHHLSVSSAHQIVPNLIETSDDHYLIEQDGRYWRAQEYEENSESHLRASNTTLAYEGAAMIGKFITSFASLDAGQIQAAIPQFHYLPKYLDLFNQVMNDGNTSRIQSMKSTIKWLLDKKQMMLSRFDQLTHLPDRICHADTKISNILFDYRSNKAVKVIDLDTVMPGKVPFDFADMVRSFVPSVDENHENINELSIREDIFVSLCEGFLSETRHVLNKEELDLLFSGAVVLVYEQTIRFLWDYLNNDQYYTVKHPEQNKTRTQNQFKLLTELLSFEKQANDIIHRIV